MTRGRLGLIGGTDSKRTSGMYDPSTNVALQDAKKYITRYGYDSVFNALASSGAEESFDISRDGIYVYVAVRGTRTTATIFQYQCSRPWDLSTITYSNKSLVVGDYDINMNSVAISDDGLEIYFAGYSGDAVWSATLSTPYDLATAVVDVKKTYVGTQDATCNTPFIGDNGTKMYVLGSTNRVVYQYTLSTPHDVSTAVYANKSFSVTTQDATAQGVFFKSDGTKMYMVGTTTDAVYSYSLSVAWDVSTASSDYSLKSYSVTTQAAEPYNTFIGDSGTKMYVLNQTAAVGAIYQYTLATPYNVATATYASKSLSIVTQDSDPRGLYFKSDGTKMYMLGNTNDAVFSYTLSTPWDISTGTPDYVAKSFLLTGQMTLTSDMFIGDNGTKMYVLSGGTATTDTVFQYTLSTAWDVTTATYASKSFSVNTQDTSTESLFFKSDGTKMYILGNTNDTIYQYSLSVAWDVSTATYDSVSFSVTAQETNPTGIYISPDGANLYVTGQTGDDVNQYVMATPWNLATASFVRVSVAIAEATQGGIHFKDDGTRLYIIGSTSDLILEYSLSTPWNVSSLTLVRQLSILFTDTTTSGIFFKTDGTKVYFCGDTSDRVYELSLSIAWNITAVTGRFSVVNEETGCTSLYISPDGLNMYVAGTTGDDVNQYSLATAWDISSAAYVRVSAAHGEATPTGLFFKSDGTKMYITGQTLDTVREFNLSIAWDVSTIVFDSSFFSGYLDATSTGVFFKPDGTEMYITGGTNNTVYQLTLNQAWRCNGVAGMCSVGFEETAPTGVYFKPDGTSMYVTGQTGDDVNQYALSSPWNISSAVYTTVSPASGEGTPTGVFFKSDGTKMYVIGSTLDAIREFNLSVAWNVSTAVFSKTLSVGFETVPSGLFFKDDGTQLYISGTTNDCVYQIPLGTAWDIGTAQGFIYIGALEVTVRGIRIASSGSILYTSGDGGNIRKFTLSTPYQLGTAVASQAFAISAPLGLDVTDDGRTIYVTVQSTSTVPPASTGRHVRAINLSTAHDLTTAALSTTEWVPLYGLTGATGTPWGVKLSSDRTRMFVLSDVVSGLYQFSLRFA